MQPISQITLGEIVSYSRDLTIAGVVLKLGWGARGIKESVVGFLKSVTEFMSSVELKLDTLNTNVNTVMNNHLHHIDQKLDIIARTADDKVSEHYAAGLSTDTGLDR